MNLRRIPLEHRERLSLVVLVILFTTLVGGAVRLQVLKHQELTERSEHNRIRVMPIIPPRGKVFDRSGNIIIDNRPSYTVAIVEAEFDTVRVLPKLGSLLGLEPAVIRERQLRNMVSRYQPAPVKRDVDFDIIAILEEQMTGFQGVTYQIEQVRQYRKETLGSSFTGYVGEASREELEAEHLPERRLGTMIGKKGLEKRYDQALRGREGTAYLEVSASGQVLGLYREKKPQPAQPGADITLTIDLDLQQACRGILDSFCCGAIVAVDPRNGDVLALASYPDYDANMFSTVIPESAWVDLTRNLTHPLLNRPLNGLYPPGSTVKPVTVGAALERGLISAQSTLKPCTGGFKFGNRIFHCWELRGHGFLTAAHAIEQSCDVFMYQLGLKLGVDELSRTFAECGFGQKTGIDLPGESEGLNPNSRYYDDRYGQRGWTAALVLNNSIGQGELLVTPLQLAQLYCGLANKNGAVYRPHILKSIHHANHTVEEYTPQIKFSLPFSNQTLDLLREGLRLVVAGEHGTARSLRNNRYSIGGKTGTVENPHGENHSWFVGFAPLEAPEIVVAVIVENAGHGAEVAAPIAGEILKRHMTRDLRPRSLVESNNEARP